MILSKNETYKLTRRQFHVLSRLAEGKSNKVICAELGLSPGTIKNYVSCILEILHVQNRTQAALFFKDKREQIIS